MKRKGREKIIRLGENLDQKDPTKETQRGLLDKDRKKWLSKVRLMKPPRVVCLGTEEPTRMFRD